MHNHKYYINKRYIGGRVIGYGSYSRVKEAIDTKNNDTIALKIVYLNRVKQNALYALGGQNANCKVENEIRILSNLDHQNIIQIYQSEWNNEKKKFYIAMELCKCNLEDLIESIQFENKNIGLDLIHLQIFFGQMIRSIEYIHDHHIVHHDIKPSNFLLGHDGNLKLIDFGSAVELKSDDEDSLPCESTGTPMFQAPELVLLEPISEKISRYALDIWAAGVTLYYLSCGHYPFQGENMFELFRNIREYYTGDISIEYHDIPNYPPLLDLIQKMLKPNHQRPTAKEILEHQFLKNSVPMEMLNRRIYEIVETRFKE